MVMRFSDMVRQSVRANPALNNGTIPGGLAYVLESGLEGWELGKDKRSRKEAMEAAALALGGLAGFGQPSAAPEQAAQAASVAPPPATFQPFSQQVHASVRDRGPAFSQPPAGASFPPAQSGPSSDRMLQAIIRQESGGRADAVSPVGARGIMQVMPATAMRPGYGMQDIFGYAERMGIPVAARDEATAKQLLMNPELNQAFGKDYYGKMRDAHGGSDTLALASYNAGAGRVQDWLKSIGDPRKGGISEAEFVSRIPFKETRDYVTKIMGSLGEPQQAQAPRPQAQDQDQAQKTAISAPQPTAAASPTTAAAVPQSGGNEAIGKLVALAQAGNPYALEALQGVMSLQQGRADKADARAIQEREWQFQQQQAQQEQAYRQAQLGMQQGTLDLHRQKLAAETAGTDFGASAEGRALAYVTDIQAKRARGEPISGDEIAREQAASAFLAQPKFHFDQASGRMIQTGGIDTGAMFGGAQPADATAAAPGSATPAPQVVQLPLTPEQEQAKAKQTQLRAETIGNVDSLLEMDLSKAAGPTGTTMSYIPGTDAQRIATRLDGIRNQFTGSNLDMLKGVLSDRDIQMLGELAGGLRVGMPAGELERTLGSMKRILQAGQDGVVPAAPPPPPPPPGSGSLSPDEEAVMRKYLPAGGSSGGW